MLGDEEWIKNILANLLLSVVNKKKMTQVELAEKLGVTEKSVSNWKNGRNTPDLSLFKPICDILDIFINELMSGEKLNQDNYQEKLEENIINLSSKNNKTYKKYLIIFFTTALVGFIIGLGLYILYETMEIDVKYDARVMECNIQNNELIFQNKGISVFNMYYTTKTINDNHYIIFHNTVYLQNKRRSNWEYGESLATYLTEGRIPFASILTFDDLEDYDNVIVYYTDDSIKKIEKLSNSEFMNELDNLHLMCQLN